ncbi:hypothetical protein ABPG72_016293 [Tetrahymena utriculariae]
MKEDEYEIIKDNCQKQYLNENNLQIIPYQAISIQLEPQQQNKQAFPNQQQKNKIEYSFVKLAGYLLDAFATNFFKICNYFYFQLNKEESLINKNDCEKLFGLEEFKNLIGRDYTKDELNQKFNRCLLFEDPNKQPTENLKQNALKRQRNFQRAKNIIYQQNDWEE